MKNNQEQSKDICRIIHDKLCKYADKKIGSCDFSKECAEEIINAGYINGADFVEFVLDKATRVWTEKRVLLGFKNLKSLLQEYLKGE